MKFGWFINNKLNKPWKTTFDDGQFWLLMSWLILDSGCSRMLIGGTTAASSVYNPALEVDDLDQGDDRCM